MKVSFWVVYKLVEFLDKHQIIKDKIKTFGHELFCWKIVYNFNYSLLYNDNLKK